MPFLPGVCVTLKQKGDSAVCPSNLCGHLALLPAGKLALNHPSSNLPRFPRLPPSLWSRQQHTGSSSGPRAVPGSSPCRTEHTESACGPQPPPARPCTPPWTLSRLHHRASFMFQLCFSGLFFSHFLPLRLFLCYLNTDLALCEMPASFL